MVTAGIILSEAAMRAGMEVTMSQSYGPEARGGAAKAEVIISDEPIYYPKVLIPHLLLVMSQQAYDVYGDELAPGGTMIIDSSAVKGEPHIDGRVIRSPIMQTARRRLKPVVANVVALGMICGATSIIERQFMEEAVLARVPRGTEELNAQAFQIGFQMGEAIS